MMREELDRLAQRGLRTPGRPGSEGAQPRCDDDEPEESREQPVSSDNGIVLY